MRDDWGSLVTLGAACAKVLWQKDLKFVARPAGPESMVDWDGIHEPHITEGSSGFGIVQSVLLSYV